MNKALLLIASLISVCAGCNSADHVSNSQVSQAKPKLHEKLAELTFNHTPTDAELIRAKTALDNAQAVCIESRDDLASQSHVVAKLLIERKVSVNAIDILEAAATINADTADRQPCTETMASYAVAREAGMNHTDTINGARQLILTTSHIASN